nr:hypothetical protein [Tanacetum cinerariifolium]
KGFRLNSTFSCVILLSVCTLCRPIGLEGCDTWDGGKGTWGGRAKGFGTTPVCAYTGEGWGRELSFGGKRSCRLLAIYSPEPKVLVGVCDFRSWDSVESGESCRFLGERGNKELEGKGGGVNSGLNVGYMDERFGELACLVPGVNRDFVS